jgi:hypothetical protein
VIREEPDGITITNKKAGLIVKLYFNELSKEVQERFHYDPVKADEYSRKQNEEQGQLQNVGDLEARYKSLQNEEYEILEEIGRAEEAKKHEWQGSGKELSKMNLLAAQLPALHSHLDDRAGEKGRRKEATSESSATANAE